MKAALEHAGWSTKEHQLPAHTMTELVRKKNEFLGTAIREVQAEFNVALGKFDSNKVEYIELAKGIARSFLRYGSAGPLLAKAILKQLQETYGLKEQVNYFTLPYPIIHYPSHVSLLTDTFE